jgi:hypothetical protein
MQFPPPLSHECERSTQSGQQRNHVGEMTCWPKYKSDPSTSWLHDASTLFLRHYPGHPDWLCWPLSQSLEPNHQRPHTHTSSYRATYVF